MREHARFACRSGLAEGEAVGLSAGIEEGDLEGAAGDGSGLADELVDPLLGEGAVAVAVGVAAVRRTGWLPVDEDPEPYRGGWCGRPHDQVEVAGVEAAGDAPAGRVQRGRLPAHGPVPLQRPL